MQIFKIFPRILDALNDGRVIKKAVACALWLAAVLSGLAALFIAYTVARMAYIPSAPPPAEYTAGLTIFLVVYLLSAVCQIQILLYRAKSILALENSQYTVVPVVSLLLRGMGESAATGICFLGFGATLAIWVSKQNPLGLVGMNMLMPSFNTSDYVLAGVVMLFWSFLLAFLLLIVFYFLAEVSHASVDIAMNIRILVAREAAHSAPPFLPAPPPLFVPPPPVATPPEPPPPTDIAPATEEFYPPPHPPADPICSSCQFQLQHGDRFCPICGSAITE